MVKATCAPRRAALAGIALPANGRATVAAAADMRRWIFRGAADAARACGASFGVAVPDIACRAATADGRAALWLGPDEWLLLAPEGTAAPLPGALSPCSLVDISHRQTGLEIAGDGAARLLNAHVLLDLDARAFPPGAVARTIFAKAEIVLWRQAGDRFHLEVWRSFAPYVAGLLAEASRDQRLV